MKKPSLFLYLFASLFIAPYLWLRFRPRVLEKPRFQEPFVVLANHQAVYDSLFLAYALFPKRTNFVGGYELYLNPKTRWIAKLFHIIPKFQYQMDIKAIKLMLQIVKKKGNLALFPTGRLSSCGQGFPATIALIKLLKKLNVHVYFCKIDGAYLSAPKWATHRRRGYVDLRTFLLFKPEDLTSLPEEKMLDIVNEHLLYNEYENQTKNPIAYRGKALAERLETILYYCPKCQQEFQLVSKDNRFFCQACDFTTTIDDHGFFIHNPYYLHPYAWFSHQEELVYQSILQKAHHLQANAVVKTSNGTYLDIVGKGQLSLGETTIDFQGSMNGKTTTFHIEIAHLPSLPYKAGVNIEMVWHDKVYVFELENGLAAVKWSITVEQWQRARLLKNQETML